MHKKKLVVALLLFIITIFLGIQTIDYALESALCGEEFGDSLVSEDTLYSAQARTKDCGATTDYTGYITLKKLKDKLFWPDANSIEVMSYRGSYSAVELKWISNQNLQIETEYCLNVFKRIDQWQDVKIFYEDRCD